MECHGIPLNAMTFHGNSDLDSFFKIKKQMQQSIREGYYATIHESGRRKGEGGVSGGVGDKGGEWGECGIQRG